MDAKGYIYAMQHILEISAASRDMAKTSPQTNCVISKHIAIQIWLIYIFNNCELFKAHDNVIVMVWTPVPS